MTVTANDNRRSYAGDGTTNPWSFPIYFISNADLTVVRRNADGTETSFVYATDYTVTGANNPAGGSVTPVAATVIGATYVIYRNPALTQSLDLIDGSPLPADPLERTFDKIVMICQRLYERIGRTLRLKESDTDGSGRYDANGNRIVNSSDAIDNQDLMNKQSVTAAIATAVTGLAPSGADYLVRTANGSLSAERVVTDTASIAWDWTTAGQAKANLADPELLALAGLTSAADALPYFTGSGTAAVTTLTAFARTLLAGVSASAVQATLGLVPGTNVQAASARLTDIAGAAWAQGDLLYFNGTNLVRLPAGTSGNFLKTLGAGANPAWATPAGGGDMLAANNLSDLVNAGTARTNLGLVIGTNVQAYDAELAAIAGLTSAADSLPYFTGLGAAALATLTSFARTLIAGANAAAMRTTLGVVIGTDVQAQNANLAAEAGLTGAADNVSYYTGVGAKALSSLTSFGRTLIGAANAAAAVVSLGAISLSATGQTITGGAIVTSNSLGTITTGTVTPDPGLRPIQHYTNNGAHTLAPSANVGSVLLDVTNGASAGAITTSGFTKVSGDAFTTTNAQKFRCHISIGNGGSLLLVQALQ